MTDEKIEQLTAFIQREVSRDPRQLITPETKLVSSGLVDSLSLIKVLAFVEDAFGVVIPDEAATAASMDSVRLIADLVDRFDDGAA